MDAISTQKFIRMSPIKLRLVADLVRGKKADEVLAALPFVNRAASLPISKVIKTAVANATVKGANPADLFVKTIEIEEGTRLKRFRPVSRGQAHSYVHKMSNIKVIVETIAKEPVKEPKTKAVSKKKVRKNEPKS